MILKTWECTDKYLVTMNNSIDGLLQGGEFIAVCSLTNCMFTTHHRVLTFGYRISECWGIDWSSNSDYLGVTQSYNYGWTLTWSSGPGGWEWYSDGRSITIYNTSTGETVDRLTTGNGNVCPYCDYIVYFEWHPFDDSHHIWWNNI